MLILTLILACEPETIREGEAEQVDLSGYATLEDLAALQERLDEQAAEVETLRAELAQVGGAPVVTTATCEGTVGYPGDAYVKLDEVVTPVAAFVCIMVDGDIEDEVERCDSTSWLTQSPSDASALTYGTLLMIEDNSDCVPGEAWGKFLYYP